LKLGKKRGIRKDEREARTRKDERAFILASHSEWYIEYTKSKRIHQVKKLQNYIQGARL